jgi:phosphatidylinositol alpha-1,6-mannosyltransferase
LAWIVKRWRGLPYLCYVHGEEMQIATLSRELGWLTRRVLRGAERVIANSRNTERILRDEWQLPAGCVQVLHPGVDTERFVPAGRDRTVRARLGWGDRRVVLTVGRLQKRKGHDQMILALASIRKALPDLLYAIVGEGEERPYLQNLVTREGLSDHVQFLGELDDNDMLRCYQQCDLFVLPNRQVGKDIEGFGMVLLEAQACGKAVLAGASGGTAETMHIPETGQVVNCDGSHELAARVTDLLSDLGRLVRMGAAARQWVVQQFDWAALSQQAEQLFERFSLQPVG